MKILNYNEYIFNKQQNMNEGFKNWLFTFLTLMNTGFLPMSVSSLPINKQEDFMKKFSKEEKDAIDFFGFLHKTKVDITNLEDVYYNIFNGKNNFDDIKKLIKTDKDSVVLDKKIVTDKISDTVHRDIDVNKILPLNYISDYANIISKNGQNKINNILNTYEKLTGIQLFVLTISSTGGYPISSYSQETGERWGVGQKKQDNGILFVVAKDDRECFIATGYGIEGILTDAKCTRIVNEVFVPHAKKGDYFQGILEVIEKIEEITGTESIELKKKQMEEDRLKAIEDFKNGMIIFLEILLVSLILGTIVTIIINRKRKKETLKKDINEFLEKINKLKKLVDYKLDPRLEDIYNKMINDIEESNIVDNVKINSKNYNTIKILVDRLQELELQYNNLYKKIYDIKQFLNRDNMDIYHKLVMSLDKNKNHLKEIGYNKYFQDDLTIIDVTEIFNILEKIKDSFNMDIDLSYHFYKRIINDMNKLKNLEKTYNDILTNVKSSTIFIDKHPIYFKKNLQKLQEYGNKKHQHFSKEIKTESQNMEKTIDMKYKEWLLLHQRENDVILKAKVLISIEKLVDDFIEKYNKKIEKKIRDNKRSTYSSGGGYRSGGGYSSGGGFGGGGGGSFGGGGGGGRW